MRRASTAGRARPLALSTWLVGASLLGGCTSNPYFIGANCRPGDAAANADPCGAPGSDQGLSFAVDLDQSGASRLSDELQLPDGPVQATLRFRGESATANDWPSAEGPLLARSLTTPFAQLEAPFTDGTRAVGLASDGPTYLADSAEPGSVDADDFASEVVLRAPPGASVIDKRGTGAGWSMKTTPTGALVLELHDGQRLVEIASLPLIAGAWYHCLFWMSRSAGGRAYCNGREGGPTDLGVLGSLAGATHLTIGGGSMAVDDRVQLAHFAFFRVPPGWLGNAVDWSALSRRRFAELTGARPRVARGSALPEVGLRNSAAYLDLERAAGLSRQLFLVGPDWPRITCRSDSAGVRDCGYLSEAERTRWIPPQASAWTSSELMVAANHADFADGERRMEALIASTLPALHVLSWTGTYGGARQAVSFFARAEAGQLVGADVSGRGMAIFDVRAGTVVSAPATVRASIEAWGDGLFRCAYVFAPVAGSATYALHLLNDAGVEPFSGDGTSAWVDVAGLQLDVGQANPGSLLASDNEAPDQLTFVADDGNLPAASAVFQRFRVLLLEGPRLTDQAVLNLNRGGAFENQVQLYITGDTSKLKFWALRDGTAHWAFDHPVSLVDGLRHSIEANWGVTQAELSVDGVSAKQDALIPNAPPFSLDRIDVGFSSKSSGSLEGLVAGLEIGAL
jgi:hypothetical protein